MLSIYESFSDYVLQYWQEKQTYLNTKIDISACLN